MSGGTVLIIDAGYGVLGMQFPSAFIVVPNRRRVETSGPEICLPVNVVLVRTRDMYPDDLPLQ
jgi:hypothetical protein